MAVKSLAEGLEFPARAGSRYATSNKLHVQTTIPVSSQLLATLDPTQLSNGLVCFTFTGPPMLKTTKTLKFGDPSKTKNQMTKRTQPRRFDYEDLCRCRRPPNIPNTTLLMSSSRPLFLAVS